jgi:hypothetical protein
MLGGRRKRSRAPLVLVGSALLVAFTTVAFSRPFRAVVASWARVGTTPQGDAGVHDGLSASQDAQPNGSRQSPQCTFSETTLLAGYDAVEFGDSASGGARAAVIVTHEKNGERIATLLVFEGQTSLPRTAVLGPVRGFDPLPRVFFDGDSAMVAIVVSDSDGGVDHRRNVLRRLVGETLEPVAEVVWPNTATTYDWSWRGGSGLFAYDIVRAGRQQIEVLDPKAPAGVKAFQVPQPEDLRFWSDGAHVELFWSSSIAVPELDGGDPNEAPGELRRYRYLMTAPLTASGGLDGEPRVLTSLQGHVGAYALTRRGVYYADEAEPAPGDGARILRLPLPSFAKPSAIAMSAPEVLVHGLDLQAGFDVVDDLGAADDLLSFVDLGGHPGLRRARPESAAEKLLEDRPEVQPVNRADEESVPVPTTTWSFRDEARLLGAAEGRFVGLEIRTQSGEPRTAKSRVQLQRFSVACPQL